MYTVYKHTKKEGGAMPISNKQREYIDNANHRWNIKSGA